MYTVFDLYLEKYVFPKVRMDETGFESICHSAVGWAPDYVMKIKYAI